MNLIARYGPAPEDTADADGVLHSTFTGFFLLQLQPAEAAAMFGTDGADAADPGALVRLAAAAWAQLTALGHGHMLVGAYSGFEYVTTGPPSCGFTLGTTDGGYPFAPKDYVPLYAVARGRRPAGQPENEGPDHVDLGVDYRGTAGPGDATIRPVIFEPPPTSPSPPGGP
jgi:hypothetical protein